MLAALVDLTHEQLPVATSRTTRHSGVHGTLKAELVACGELSGRSFATLSDSGT